MIDFDIPKNQSSIIKVIGVGGGGSNAVNYMYSQNVEGVDFIVCNTDAKALELSEITNKIQLGPHLTQGLGAGANPNVGKKATEESLDEIRRILEVNTKMAFICAGMGGGTGTGGAPIIAKICQEMGILTVGIVTTPFSFEGPKRRAQAEAGIRELEPFVDTLLVVSNDKLKMLYTNLKIREAFGKADDILATAAKCITDIINSKGHIIVDFADVSTVMRNGGVAILGSAQAEGETRAQKAIELALNSPLLNDNDIRGAKWILLNVITGSGEYECGMDEFELINDYVRMNAGEDTDVIVGMGVDDNLGKGLSVTLIATGFENKDPFEENDKINLEARKKDVVILNLQDEEREASNHNPVVIFPRKEEENQNENVAQSTNETETTSDNIINESAEEEAPKTTEDKIVLNLDEEVENDNVSYGLFSSKEKEITPEPQPDPEVKKEEPKSFLSRPSAIYTERPAEEEITEENTDVEDDNLSFTYHENATEHKATSIHQGVNFLGEDLTDEELQKRRAAERIQKLRNLSFDVNSNDPNSELDSVPAYVRRKLENLKQGGGSTAEEYYSKITVDKTEENKINLSTLNSFLDGKKPD